MKEQELYYGFGKEKQAEYEKQIIDRFGEQGKAHISESKQNVKDWSKADWETSKKDSEAICKELVGHLEQGLKTNSRDVQNTIRKHYQWLKKFWTPTKETYASHGQFIVESDLRKAYEAYHPQLPKFIAEAIQVFAKTELK